MPNTSLHSVLHDLASGFAESVLAAIRGASLEELLDGRDAPRPQRHNPALPRGWTRSKARLTATGKSTVRPTARGKALPRRSAEDVAKTLASVVALVKGKPAGLRSEQIRAALKLDKRELPRVLSEGLATKKLKSRGQKRATTYFVG